jgi:hypothetical protein
MVQLVGGVAVAIETHITALHTVGVDQLAPIGLDVIEVLARAQAKLVGLAIVEDGGHFGPECGFVRDLHRHVTVDTHLRMGVPVDDGVDARVFAQVDLHPLLAGPEFEPRTFVTGLIAIGDHVQRADVRVVVAGDYLLAPGKVHRTHGNIEIRALTSKRRLKIGHADGHRRSGKHRWQ